MRWMFTSIEVILLKFWIVSSFLLKIAIRSSLEGHPKAHRVGIYCCNFITGILISRDRRLFIHTQLYFNSFSFLVIEYTRSNSFYPGISHRFVLQVTFSKEDLNSAVSSSYLIIFQVSSYFYRVSKVSIRRSSKAWSCSPSSQSISLSFVQLLRLNMQIW